MSAFRRALLVWAGWVSMSALLAFYAITRDEVIPAFLSGALFVSSLWDLKDKAVQINDAAKQKVSA